MAVSRCEKQSAKFKLPSNVFIAVHDKPKMGTSRLSNRLLGALGSGQDGATARSVWAAVFPGPETAWYLDARGYPLGIGVQANVRITVMDCWLDVGVEVPAT